MFQPTSVQAGMAQGGGQVVPRQSFNGAVSTPSLYVPNNSKLGIILDIDDIDWTTPGKTVTIRTYRTISGLRSLHSEDVVATGPTIIKGIPSAGRKPTIRFPCGECDVDVEVEVSGAINAILLVEK
jgi:hypothetical protein